MIKITSSWQKEGDLYFFEINDCAIRIYSKSMIYFRNVDCESGSMDEITLLGILASYNLKEYNLGIYNSLLGLVVNELSKLRDPGRYIYDYLFKKLETVQGIRNLLLEINFSKFVMRQQVFRYVYLEPALVYKIGYCELQQRLGNEYVDDISNEGWKQKALDDIKKTGQINPFNYRGLDLVNENETNTITDNLVVHGTCDDLLKNRLLSKYPGIKVESPMNNGIGFSFNGNGSPNIFRSDMKVRLFPGDNTLYKLDYGTKVTPLGKTKAQIKLTPKSSNYDEFKKRFFKYGSLFKKICEQYYLKYLTFAWENNKNKENIFEFIEFLLTDEGVFNELLWSKCISVRTMEVLVQMLDYGNRDVADSVEMNLISKENEEEQLIMDLEKEKLLTYKKLVEAATLAGYSSDELFWFVASNKLLKTKVKALLFNVLVSCEYVMSVKDLSYILDDAQAFEKDIDTVLVYSNISKPKFYDLCKLAMHESSFADDLHFYDWLIKKELVERGIKDKKFERKCLAMHIIECSFKSQQEFSCKFPGVDINVLRKQLVDDDVKSLANELKELGEAWKKNKKKTREKNKIEGV